MYSTNSSSTKYQSISWSRSSIKPSNEALMCKNSSHVGSPSAGMLPPGKPGPTGVSKSQSPANNRALAV